MGTWGCTTEWPKLWVEYCLQAPSSGGAPRTWSSQRPKGWAWRPHFTAEDYGFAGYLYVRQGQPCWLTCPPGAHGAQLVRSWNLTPAPSSDGEKRRFMRLIPVPHGRLLRRVCQGPHLGSWCCLLHSQPLTRAWLQPGEHTLQERPRGARQARTWERQAPQQPAARLQELQPPDHRQAPARRPHPRPSEHSGLWVGLPPPFLLF